MKIRLASIVAAVLMLSSCSPRDLNAHNAWARPAKAGNTAVVYLLLHNHNDQDDELIGLSTSSAETAEIHKSSTENDVAKMEMLKSLPLASGDEYTFEPGALHVMLVGIKQDLNPGDHFPLILHFKNHEDISVDVEVTDQADAGSGHNHP